VTHCLKTRTGHIADIGRPILNYKLVKMILLGAATKFAIKNSTRNSKAAKSSKHQVLSSIKKNTQLTFKHARMML
jgi:hypothetical protein